MLTGQLRISAQWEGLVSAGLSCWLCALLPREDSAAGQGACRHLPHAAPPQGDREVESLKGPQAALSLGRQQSFPTGTALLVPNLHEKP